jgi:predicted amidohydrolase
MSFRIALVQMSVVGGDKRANLEHARDLIAQAKDLGADLVLLPEAMDLGWTHPRSRTDAEAVPDGMPCALLAAEAAKRGIFICAGLTEAAGERVFNTAIILDRQGHLICKHRKLNELSIGQDTYDQGDRLGVVQTELGTLGLMICADGFAQDQVLSRSLGYMGADLILSPCAWAVPADHDNHLEPYGGLWREVYGPVAKAFSMWILATSNVGKIEEGPWAGRRCIGCSLVVDPDGHEVLQGPYGVDAETILTLDLEPRKRPARGCGWDEHWRNGPAGKP